MKKNLLCYALLYVLLPIGSCYTNTINNIMHDPFTVFYPHLGDSFCRGSSFNIVWDENLSIDQKINEWKKYKKICSKDGSYQLILADIYLSCEKNWKAKKVLESCIEKANFDTKYHEFLLHEVYMNLQNVEKALNLANSMIKNYPDFYGGYQNIAVNFICKQYWLQAEKYLEKALSLNNESSGIYNLLAVISYELREDSKALRHYEKALSLDPLKTLKNKHSTMRMAAIFILENNFEIANKHLDYLLQFNPSVIQDYRFIGLKEQCREGLAKAVDSDKSDSD